MPALKEAKQTAKENKLVKFSKAAGPFLSHKAHYFDESQKILAFQKEQFELYSKQPRRTQCKNCDAPLGEGHDFVKLGVKYVFCEQCSHLNGCFEDTDAFCKAIYTDNNGQSYAKNYTVEEKERYKQRVADIYTPKADFLLEALAAQCENGNAFSYADFGAGCGYFVSALKEAGLADVKGYEVSKTQVDLAEQMLGEPCVEMHGLDENVEILKHTKAEVVSFIGVLEHLQNPREVLQAIKDNKNIRYAYFSLPLFSFSVLFEKLFSDVMQRVLVGGHTHLYTPESIEHLCKEFNFATIGEWWFGTEAIDLYRAAAVELSGDAKLSSYLQKHMVPMLDDLQAVFDQKKRCAQLHFVVRND